LEWGLKRNQNTLLLKIAVAAVFLVVVVAASKYQLDVYAAKAESNKQAEAAELANLTEAADEDDAADAADNADSAAQPGEAASAPSAGDILDETRILPADTIVDDIGVGAEILPIPREYKISNIKNRLTELGIENQLVAGVNLATQTAWVYLNGKIIWESPVVTAYNELGFETPVGVYDIHNKIENHSLYRGYKCDYWLGFNADWQEGFHDAQWREDWGPDAHKYDGSGGCVNVPLEAMQQLFELLDIGDTVWIHDYRDQL
jgi:lipoprotein-anchoring transpeptidase ErfK/SrfK